jgi:hypothetical protein
MSNFFDSSGKFQKLHHRVWTYTFLLYFPPLYHSTTLTFNIFYVLHLKETIYNRLQITTIKKFYFILFVFKLFVKIIESSEPYTHSLANY